MGVGAEKWWLTTINSTTLRSSPPHAQLAEAILASSITLTEMLHACVTPRSAYVFKCVLNGVFKGVFKGVVFRRF